MTAEVAVLNKSAVALAADSAMSVTVDDTRKTYPTNKLFALSKRHPVGIMIYNNAEFMDVPWETIVKMYRDELGAAHRPTVKDYAEDFLGYVGNDTICTIAQRHRNFFRIAEDVFWPIAYEVTRRMDGGETDAPTVVRDVVAKHSAAFVNAGDGSSMRTVDARALVRVHERDIDDMISRRFAAHAIGSQDRRALHAVLETAIKSAEMSNGHSGLVFAGFGANEMFPSLVEIVTDGSIGDVVKAEFKTLVDIGRADLQATIAPFAQSDMVERFMEGMDRQFWTYVQLYVAELLTSVSRYVVTTTQEGPLTDDQSSGLQNMIGNKLSEFQQATNGLSDRLFVDPIMSMVAQLPKEELASMAEALVSLTSLQRRVSIQEESVGGPVDVAVVSKGDGFVWIKRKHYFDPMLNRDYLVRQSPSHANVQGGMDGQLRSAHSQASRHH